MRTPDDPDANDFKPLGAPIRKPEPARPEWEQVPGAAKGVERNRAGQLRTNIPENEAPKFMPRHTVRSQS